MYDIECIHCGELVDSANRDHWRTCEKHPARAEVDRLNHAIATLISKSHQNAGNIQNPFAWIDQRDWEEFLKAVEGET